MSEQKTIKCHCNRCGHSTKHTLLHQEEKSGSVCSWTVGGHRNAVREYSLLECCGCEDVVLKVVTSVLSERGEKFHSEDYYPPRVSRRKPQWLDDLPPEYLTLVDEVYSALHAGSRTLAMMGARALLDIFIERKVGNCGNFTAGLDSLVEQKYLAPVNRPVIESAVEAGNAAAHRAYRPPPDVLNAVMDIVENLVQHEVLEKSARDVKKMTPERERHQENEKKGTP